METTLNNTDMLLRENERLKFRLIKLELEMLKRRESEERSKENELKLSQLIASKDKLFSIIAHDLRNPFTALIGISDMLSTNFSSYTPQKTELMLSHINSAAKSAFLLVENLLIWARSQNGQLKFNPQETNITELLKENILNLQSLMVLKRINILFLSEDTITGWVDEQMLNTIIRNLLTNAIKFSHIDGIIKISAHSDGKNITISIKDQGIGIPEDIQQILFKLKTNISMTGTAHEKGTGIGLVLCAELIEKQHGHIWVESELGKGSRFTFSIPNCKKEISAYTE